MQKPDQKTEKAEVDACEAMATRKACEASVSLARLVSYWAGALGEFSEEEGLWGELLRRQAVDLGLRDVFEELPKKGQLLALSDFKETLEALRRRGVDLAHAHLLFEQKGEPDVLLSVPRAFPDLGLMPTPDPRRVGLLS